MFAISRSACCRCIACHFPASALLTQFVMLQTSKPKSGADSVFKLSGATGLSLQDSKERAKQRDAELLAEGLSKRQESQNGTSTSAANGSHSRDDHSNRHGRDEEGRPGQYRDSPDRDRHWDRDRKRQHRSRSRDRHSHSKRRRTVSPEERGPAGNRPPPAPLLDKPEKDAIYKGRVSGVMDFGCFVELQGLRRRVEGLVHITNLSNTRFLLCSTTSSCTPTQCLMQH